LMKHGLKLDTIPMVLTSDTPILPWKQMFLQAVILV